MLVRRIEEVSLINNKKGCIETMNGMHHVGTRETVIIGPSVSRNQLLAYVLDASSGVTARVCADIEEFHATAESGRQIVVVLDAQDERWIEYLVGLQQIFDDVNVVSIALANVRRDHGTERRAFQLGSSGFFYVDDSMDTVVRGLSALLQGQSWISRQVLMACSAYSQNQQAAQSDSGLTNRESEVLTLLCNGATNRDIADTLTISPHTVRTHLNNLFRKINVPNRLQAVRWGNRYLS